MDNQLFALRWKPVGYGVTFKAYIIAEDTFEADYIWHKFRKANKDVRETWDRAFDRVQGYATFHPAAEWEISEFKAGFPRKRKVGVYLFDKECEKAHTDHLND